jgi:NMD protein affecting ribosome stability and mRNA decay
MRLWVGVYKVKAFPLQRIRQPHCYLGVNLWVAFKFSIKVAHCVKRRFCRPRVRWIDIRETLQEHQMTITETARKAKTRSLYLLDTQKSIRGSKDKDKNKIRLRKKC